MVIELLRAGHGPAVLAFEKRWPTAEAVTRRRHRGNGAPRAAVSRSAATPAPTPERGRRHNGLRPRHG
ncbi:hypothetical protein OG239_03705 [Streptomyces sp. NBC_00868]|uniref:hypothetical protein n=1 Tax=unclassified Streptomyces TaxID=2593676 RepID=UPI0032519A2C|nr:hypothetical protein OG239_03705 [Streptomyces sp. NBC_00868]